MKVLFLHTSPAAIAPVNAYYKEAAPDLEVITLLDDGLLPLLAEGRHELVERRLASLLEGARADYDVRAALLTCSSVTKATLASLRARVDIPIVKIDEGMARAAVSRGRNIGVLATFPATLATTRALLDDAAAEAGMTVRVREEVAEGAYAALLGGDSRSHDEAVIAAARRLDQSGVDVVVLAQVSLTRVLPRLEPLLSAPVLASPPGSLRDLRAALAGTGGGR